MSASPSSQRLPDRLVKEHDFSRADKATKIARALAAAGRRSIATLALLLVCMTTFWLPSASAQKATWREATEAELQALLPARAPVEKEHIETESSTASGITDGKGHFIAGIVLITAGYSADGKYSHYLIVQSPMAIDGVHLAPGEYVFGYSRDGDSLNVRLYEALTGKPVGTAKANRIPGSTMVKSLRIMPPSEKPFIQIGRFGIPYELADK